MPLVEIPDKQMVVEFPNTMTAGEIEKAILADVYGKKDAPAKDSFDMGVSTDARRVERAQEPELSPAISTITNKPIPTAEEKFRQSDFITSAPASAAAITTAIPAGIASGLVGVWGLIRTGDIDKAKAVMDEINAQPEKFIKTPQQAETVKNISKVIMYLPEKGKEWAGKIAEAELQRLSPEDQKKLGAIKPIMETAGEFGVLAAFPLLKKAVAKSTWYRMLSNEERGLVVQSLDDVLKNNPNMTEGEILRKWDNPNFKREALAKRMKTEQEMPLPEAQATPQAISKPTGLPISDLQKAIAKQVISETLAQNGLTPETFLQIANRTESLAPETSLGTLPAEASSVSPKAPEQAPDYNAEAEKLGIAYNGMQERFNKPPLPMFTDNKTGSSFMVKPDETPESALQRTRDGYKPEVKPVAEDVKAEVSKVKDGNLKDAKIANEFNDSIAKSQIKDVTPTATSPDKPTSPEAAKQEISTQEGTGKGQEAGLSKLAETEAVKEQKGEVGTDINQEPEAKTSFAPEIEQAYQSAKGVKQEGIVSKIKEIATEVSNKFTRTYESLAESGENSQLIFDLKKLEKQKEVAADKTVRTVGEVLSELNPNEYDVFSRKLFLDDLYDDLKRELYQDKDMPFNFTEKSLIAEKKKIDKAANANPKILNAIEKRKAAWEQVKTEYVSALKPYKEGVEDMFRENYYRHQVLDYVTNQGIFGTGKRIKAPVNKGYTKGRKGVSNLYNTDFFEAEHNIMAQMLYDIEVAKTLTGIKKLEDISDKLKAEAKKQDIEDWKSLIPEGYIEWQPREGQVFYPVMSVNEKLAEKLATDQIENLVGPEIAAQLKQVLAVGGKRKQWIVREEVADTLNNLVKDRGEGIVSQADLQIMSSWKKWQLISPRRAFKYNLRNLSGDAEATFLGNPQGFKKAWQATKELYEVFYGKKPMTPEMESWFNRGGMGSTLQAQEMDQVKKLWIFKRLYKKDADINILKKAWDTVRLATDFRESILRYANYLSCKEQLAKNGKVTNYGASNPEMIDALSDPDDKAFWLSNDLLGAYDKVSVAGQTIRERMIPFWSWQEVNFKRYVRLFKNAANDGKLTSAIGKKLGAKGLLTAMRIGRFALKAAAFAAMLQAWNYLFFKKEEEELPRDVRTRTHIILGKDKDGNINYFNRLGTLDDFVSWFGLDFVPKNTVDLMNGRQTWQEAAKDQATKTYQAPINKVVQGSAPFMKLAGELITRRSTFPDTFKPGTVRDRGLHVARSVGLENEYIAMTGKPSKGYGESLKNLFVYRIDPGEAAYRNTIDLKMSFMKKQGKVSEGFWLTPSGDTLYNMKLAVRYNDKEAFGKYLKEYIALNQGKSLSDIAKKASDGIKRMHPLNGLSANEQAAFIATSNKEDKKNIEKAIKFYYDVLSKMGQQEKKP